MLWVELVAAMQSSHVLLAHVHNCTWRCSSNHGLHSPQNNDIYELLLFIENWTRTFCCSHRKWTPLVLHEVSCYISNVETKLFFFSPEISMALSLVMSQLYLPEESLSLEATFPSSDKYQPSHCVSSLLQAQPFQNE